MTSTPLPYSCCKVRSISFVPNADEIRALAPDVERWLPRPEVIFLEDEGATPIRGFPFLLSPELAALRTALERFVLAEEELQAAVFLRRSAPRQALPGRRGSATARCCSRRWRTPPSPAMAGLSGDLLAPPLAGRRPPAQGHAAPHPAPRLGTGRAHGDTIKYRILDRYLDRVLTDHLRPGPADSPATPRRSRRSCSPAC